jgi:hypothetical protein
MLVNGNHKTFKGLSPSAKSVQSRTMWSKEHDQATWAGEFLKPVGL